MLVIQHPYAYLTSLERRRKVRLSATDGLGFGHGYLPRVELGNYRALERALGLQSLFDPEPVSLPWVILDGSWVTTNRDILPMLRSAGTRYLIDTSAWRFQTDSAFSVARTGDRSTAGLVVSKFDATGSRRTGVASRAPHRHERQHRPL